jgi:hypothetical protein
MSKLYEAAKKLLGKWKPSAKDKAIDRHARKQAKRRRRKVVL